jgi:hypothetical protein
LEYGHLLQLSISLFDSGIQQLLFFADFLQFGPIVAEGIAFGCTIGDKTSFDLEAMVFSQGLGADRAD